MGIFWLAVILFIFLGLAYWMKGSVRKTDRLYVDNRILRKLKLNEDADLVKILHETGADVFELKDISELEWSEGDRYFDDIERLFDKIQSHFKSECAQLLIEHRHEDIDYILKVENLCEDSECDTCTLKKMKRDLRN